MAIEAEDRLYRQVRDFSYRTPKEGVCNVLIYGPNKVPTTITSFIVIFPTLEDRHHGFTQFSSGTGEDLYKRVLSVEIPEDLKKNIREEGYVDDEVRRDFNEAVSIESNMPSMLLVFGETDEEQVPVAAIWTLVGISPETGLRELQDISQAILNGRM